jgi:hypothetical protein
MNGNFVCVHQTSQGALIPVEPGMSANARTLLRSRIESGDPPGPRSPCSRSQIRCFMATAIKSSMPALPFKSTTPSSA